MENEKFKNIIFSVSIGTVIGIIFPNIFIFLDLSQLGEEVNIESIKFIIISQNLYLFSFVVFPFVFSLIIYFYRTLLASQKYLQEANRMILEEQEKAAMNAKFASIGILSAGIGHEINNPLSVILMNSKFIKKDLESF